MALKGIANYEFLLLTIKTIKHFRWNANAGIYENFDDIELQKSCPLGVRLAEDVAKENINCKWVKISRLGKPRSEWMDSNDRKEVEI